MKLRLTLTGAVDGWHGAPLESDPAVWVEGMWPGARVGQKVTFGSGTAGAPRTAEVTMRLPSLVSGGQTKRGLVGDTVWFSLTGLTHYAAVKDIDEKQSRYAQLDLEQGTTCIELGRLVTAEAALDLPFIDGLLHQDADRKLKLKYAQGNARVLVDPAGVLGSSVATRVADMALCLANKATLRVEVVSIESAW